MIKLINIILIIFLMQNIAFAQIVELDSIQTKRVSRTCQLWGHLKYFHPNLSDNSIDWESAFTNNIEGVIIAKSSDDFGEAVQKMLDQLNDPSTKVLMDNDIKVAEDTLKYPIVKFIQDSILLFSVKDYNDLEDFYYPFEQFSSLNEKIPLSGGVVFDIRSMEELGDLRGYLSWFFELIEWNFFTEEIQLPGLMARFHDGFSPETGGNFGGFYSGYYTKESKKIAPGRTTAEKSIVFIVNKHSDIPMIALALQMADKAKIISTDPLSNASLIEPFIFKLDDSLNVALRLNELPSGIALKEDYLIPQNTEEEEITHMALQLIKGEKIQTPFQNKESKPTTVAKKDTTKNTGASYPDLGHRLLAAAKIWTVIHYFFAYKDLMEEDWDEVLREFIPRLALVTDSLEYHLAVAEMYNNIQDGHGFIKSKVLNEYFGQASPPIKIRFIEEQPVITGLLPDSVFKVRGVDVGDIILAINGESAKDRFNRYAKIITSSNQSGLKNSISKSLLNGNDSTDITLKILKEDGRIKSVTLPRNNYFNQNLKQLGNDRNNEPVTRLINENIGYADLDRLTTDMVDQMFDDFRDTKAIIFDMRGYPNTTAWSIAPYLTNKKNVYAANFRRYSPMGINIGESTHMTFFNQEIPPPMPPTYNGQTLMLIDERTQSQAEHTGLFFEVANGTKFIGGQSAGANGDVTNFEIPGNIILFFSCHDVRHIDGRQLQKIGLVPDIPVKPTIEGIRKGKDEVLEKAIEYVESKIQK